MVTLSNHRRARVWTVGISATFALYALTIAVAEPLKGFAATSSSSSIVLLEVQAAITNSCTSSINIGPLTSLSTGDTTSTPSYDHLDVVRCKVSTNNSTGYSFGWLVQTGTGTAGSRSGTGHMNGFRYVGSGHRIAAYTPAVANLPEAMSVAATDSRWAGRLSARSSTTTGANISWDVDANAKYLNVATGSTVNIAKRNSYTYQYAGSDSLLIQFRAIVGASKIQPTDTYKVTVVFTAVTNP